MTQPLAAGELIFVTNTNRLWIGNGTTLGGVAVTEYTDENARDASAAMFVTGTHNSITFAYDDALNKVNATVDLSDYQGVIKAAAFNGSVVANDSSLLIDGNTGKFNLSGSVSTDIIPDADVVYDLGSPTFRFRDLYLSGSSIKLGAATITATGTAVNLPAGSTIGGSAIGIPGGDLNVNIVADDSTIIVNTTTEVVTAQGGFVGNVTGNVNGIVTGTAGSSLTGNVIGNVTGNVNGIVTGTAGSSLIGNVTGNVEGDIRGSVFGQDSTMLVDGTGTGKIVGPIQTNSITINKDLGEFVIQSEGDINDSYNLFLIDLANNEVDGSPKLQLRSRGTIDSRTIVLSGDTIAADYYLGHNGTTHIPAVIVTAKASGTVTSGGAVPGAYEISTLNNAGTLVSAFKVDHTQLLHVANNSVVAGGASGQVNLGGGVVGYLKMNIGGTNYAVPYYGLNP
jgi:hypothetical protein